MVAKSQKAAAADTQANPFRVGDLVLFPNLGEPLHKASSKGLSMFLTIYPGKGSGAPKMSIELAQKGQALGQLPIQLPAPDQSGRIQYTGTIPLDAFPPGEYELKAMVTDGTTKATRSERFTVSHKRSARISLPDSPPDPGNAREAAVSIGRTICIRSRKRFS